MRDSGLRAEGLTGLALLILVLSGAQAGPDGVGAGAGRPSWGYQGGPEGMRGQGYRHNGNWDGQDVAGPGAQGTGLRYQSQPQWPAGRGAGAEDMAGQYGYGSWGPGADGPSQSQGYGGAGGQGYGNAAQHSAPVQSWQPPQYAPPGYGGQGAYGFGGTGGAEGSRNWGYGGDGGRGMRDLGADGLRNEGLGTIRDSSGVRGGRFGGRGGQRGQGGYRSHGAYRGQGYNRYERYPSYGEREHVEPHEARMVLRDEIRKARSVAAFILPPAPPARQPLSYTIPEEFIR